MSLTGNIKSGGTLKGKINGLKTIHGYSAYEVAVIEGFRGTKEEWLASLKGEKGDRGERGIQAHYDEETKTLFITGIDDEGGNDEVNGDKGNNDEVETCKHTDTEQSIERATENSPYHYVTEVCNECGETTKQQVFCTDEDGDGLCDVCGGCVPYCASHTSTAEQYGETQHIRHYTCKTCGKSAEDVAQIEDCAGYVKDGVCLVCGRMVSG